MDSGRDSNRVTTLLVQSDLVASTNLNLTATPISGVNPLNVAIVDGSGVQITTFGGTTTNYALETGGNLATIVTNTNKIPSLGQTIAANSVPVILPSATITTLTPPAAITGFATSAKQLADGHNVTVDNLTGAAAVNIQDGGNAITVDGSVTVNTISGFALEAGHLATIDTNTGKIPPLGQALAASSVPVVLTASQLSTLTPLSTVGVTGTFWQATQPVSGTVTANISGSISNTTFAATQATAANLNATVVGTGTFVTQSTLAAETTKVIGTVNQGTSPWVISGAVTNTVLSVVGAGAAATAQRVQLSDESLAALENITVISSGTVTANAGTNLNTSALALEAGGNLATIAGAVSATHLQVDVLTAPTTAVTGTFYQTTQPISGAVTNTVLSVVGGGTEATAQRVTIASDSTGLLSVDDNGGSLTVDGAFYQATQPVSLVSVPSHAVTNAGTFAVQAAATLGAETTKVIGTVNVAASQTIAVTNAGTFVSQENGAALTALQLIDNIVSGAGINQTQVAGTNIVTGGVAGSQGIGGTGAESAAVTGNPINNGGTAVTAEKTATHNGDAVGLVADLVGKLIVLPYSNPENFIDGTTAAIVDTTTTSIIASAGGSLRNYITSIIVTNSHATVGTFVKITDGASNIMWEGYAASLGGGFTQSFPVPLRGTAATAVNAICVTTGANVIVSCAGYVGI